MLNRLLRGFDAFFSSFTMLPNPAAKHKKTKSVDQWIQYEVMGLFWLPGTKFVENITGRQGSQTSLDSFLYYP